MPLSNLVSKFIEKEELFGTSATLLCGISGGPDSMAMLRILHSLGYRIIVAHVNYLLRNSESKRDQALVEHFCRQNDIPFFLYALSDDEVIDLKNGNLQEKARVIRYRFFNELLMAQGADYICTAHTMDDVVETFFLNLNRSSGTRGLRSIQAKSGNIRRPLLDLEKHEILEYLYANNIEFGSDHSNLNSEYDRNYIRNELLPILAERWPHASKAIYKSSRLIQKDFELLNHFIQSEMQLWVKEVSADTITIGPLDELFGSNHGENLLYHIIRDYGFNNEQIQNIKEVAHETGRRFFSESHESLINRNQLIIRKIHAVRLDEFEIPGPGIYSISGIRVRIATAENPTDKNDLSCCTMDYSKVKWPLTLRNWKEGDKIQPLGMGGNHKLVSDLFVDEKIDSFTKKEVKLFVDGNGDVIWIPNLRLAELVKYDEHTESYLSICWNNS